MTLMAGSIDHRWVDYQAACKVELPEPTKTYRVVSNKYAIDRTKELILNDINAEVESEKYVLSGKDQRMFGVISLRADWIDPKLPLSIGLRNSYDKSVGLGVAYGQKVFVCDNLMFDADCFMKVRRHTKKVMPDFDEILRQVGPASREKYGDSVKELMAMKTVDLTKDRGFELLGRAYGNKVLTATMFTTAAKHWAAPPFEEFEGEDNLWGWYNACTWAVGQKAPAHEVISKSIAVRDAAKAVINYHLNSAPADA